MALDRKSAEAHVLPGEEEHVLVVYIEYCSAISGSFFFTINQNSALLGRTVTTATGRFNAND